MHTAHLAEGQLLDTLSFTTAWFWLWSRALLRRALPDAAVVAAAVATRHLVGVVGSRVLLSVGIFGVLHVEGYTHGVIQGYTHGVIQGYTHGVLSLKCQFCNLFSNGRVFFDPHTIKPTGLFF
jgi:hypothetical protein